MTTAGREEGEEQRGKFPPAPTPPRGQTKNRRKIMNCLKSATETSIYMWDVVLQDTYTDASCGKKPLRGK